MTPQPTPPADDRPALSRVGELFALAAGTFADETADRCSYATQGLAEAVRAVAALHLDPTGEIRDEVDVYQPTAGGRILLLRRRLGTTADELVAFVDADAHADAAIALARLVALGRLHRQAMVDGGMTPAAAVKP